MTLLAVRTIDEPSGIRGSFFCTVVFRGIEALAEAGTDPAVLRDAADAALAHAGLGGRA